MSKKNALITGATSGIGKEVAKHLVSKGYSTMILGRSQDKLDALVLELKQINENAKISTVHCDFSSLDEIRRACEALKKENRSIDLLILNAGLWNFKYIETEDSIEETFQVNLLAPFILFQELQSLLANENSKVIFTASGLHQGKIYFDDIEFRTKFSGFKSYRQSKLGIILLTKYLASQFDNDRISFYCVHPGMVNTKLGRNAGTVSRSIFQLMGKSSRNGAKTHVHLIDAEAKLLSSGAYYANSRETQSSKYSTNMEVAKKLYVYLLDLYQQKYSKN